MKRRKFLLVTMGAPGGDVNPVIGLALELVRRGHGITIASNGSHREKIERLGLDYLCLRPAMDQNQLQTWMEYAIQSSIEGNRYMVRDLVLPHVEWNYHELEKAVPDYDVLLCHTLAYSVPLVAKKLGKPWVSFVISPLVYHAEYGRRRIIGRGASRDFLWRIPLPAFVAKAIGSLGKKIVDPWVAPLKKLRESLDLPDLGDVHILEESQNSPHLNLAFFSGLFAPAREGWPQPMCQTGFIFHQQEKESLSRATREFLDKGDPPLLFSLGTSGSGTEGQRFCEVAAEASLLMDKRAILVTGSNTEIVQNIPRDDRLLPIAYEPFSQLVPQVRTLVHIGGVGTIAYGLHGGKPQVLVPFTYEQCDNALRLQDLGVSATIPIARLDSSILGRKIKQVEEDAYRERALEIQAQIAEENGAEAAADQLEALLIEQNTGQSPG